MNAICRTPNLAIPDGNANGIEDTMTIAASGIIADLDVALQVAHTYVGDLAFTLEHEDTGTTITFIDRPGVPASTFGCSSNNIDATFDDEGADGAVETTCNGSSPALAGSLTPSPDALAAFDGENMSGDWTLTVSDNVSVDTGTIAEWCLVIVEACAAPTAVPSNHTGEFEFEFEPGTP